MPVDVEIVAAGISCRQQIEHLTGEKRNIRRRCCGRRWNIARPKYDQLTVAILLLTRQ